MELACTWKAGKLQSKDVKGSESPLMRVTPRGDKVHQSIVLECLKYSIYIYVYTLFSIQRVPY